MSSTLGKDSMVALKGQNFNLFALIVIADIKLLTQVLTIIMQVYIDAMLCSANKHMHLHSFTIDDFTIIVNFDSTIIITPIGYCLHTGLVACAIILSTTVEPCITDALQTRCCMFDYNTLAPKMYFSTMLFTRLQANYDCKMLFCNLTCT